MTWAFDLHYQRPADASREESLIERITQHGGRLDHREESVLPGVANNVCLTFEFDRRESASDAASELNQLGEHVEGPYEYG